MIKNTITYKNKNILTIFHQGFPKNQFTKKRSRKERIQNHWIVFTEENVLEDEWNTMDNYVWEERALLTPKEKYNPYHDRACAQMVHRIRIDKPAVIWKKDGTTINEEDLGNVLCFIKKYTGMDLKEQPVFLGDVFLFSPSEFQYHSNKENSVIIHKLKAGMKLIVHFKKQDSIVQVKIIDIAEDTEELEVKAECDWNNHDIEVYEGSQLIYINKNISYIKNLHLKLSMAGRKKRIPLTTLQEYYEYDEKSVYEDSIVGTPPEQIRESLADMNRLLVRKIGNNTLSDDFLFVQPGELSIAMKKITDIIFRAEDELWLIDSYFTDTGSGLHQMTDWLRLIVNSKAKQKNIIFYCNENKALNATELKDYMKKDPVIQEAILSKQIGNFQLLQTKKAIHDRFLFIRNGEEYAGISIGTSFNSLNSNHYCINRLAHKEVETVIEGLYAWMETNVIAREECRYDER